MGMAMNALVIDAPAVRTEYPVAKVIAPLPDQDVVLWRVVGGAGSILPTCAAQIMTLGAELNVRIVLSSERRIRRGVVGEVVGRVEGVAQLWVGQLGRLSHVLMRIVAHRASHGEIGGIHSARERRGRMLQLFEQRLAHGGGMTDAAGKHS